MLTAPTSGGALVVQHEGNQLVYDWSSADPLKIGWAAFYIDCELEVEQMQSGHRITLAYNLYVADRVGWTLHQPSPSVDPCQMVLYGMLKSMLSSPGFLRSGKTTPNICPRPLNTSDIQIALTSVLGGVLGVYCSHKYAHTNGSAERRLPSALKGVDFAVYAAFRALGLAIKVEPILDDSWGFDDVRLCGKISSSMADFALCIDFG